MGVEIERGQKKEIIWIAKYGGQLPRRVPQIWNEVKLVFWSCHLGSVQSPRMSPLWAKANVTVAANKARLGQHRICWFYKLVLFKESKLPLFHRCRNWDLAGSSELKTGSFERLSSQQAMLWQLHNEHISSKENQTTLPRHHVDSPGLVRKGSSPRRSSVYSRAHALSQDSFDHYEVSTNTEWMRKKMATCLTSTTLMRNEAYSVFSIKISLTPLPQTSVIFPF